MSQVMVVNFYYFNGSLFVKLDRNCVLVMLDRQADFSIYDCTIEFLMVIIERMKQSSILYFPLSKAQSCY